MFCGVDIGGTNAKVGLVDETGRLVDHDNIKTGLYKTPSDLVLTLAYTILRLQKVNKVKVEAIGVCCPNACALDGTVNGSANLKFQEKFSLTELFGTYFSNLPIAVDNDANAATLGEMFYGKARNLKDFLFVTLGTGVGGGVVSNGQLVYGLNAMAGEIGHIVVEPGGRACGCGRKGCLERYVAAPGAVETYLGICAEQNIAPKTDNYRGLADLALAGDEQALQTYRSMGRYLGAFLANLACVTAPTHIFLFGGVARVGDILLEPVREAFNENLLFCYKDGIKIELSGLMDSMADAAIMGAAALAKAHR
ncbi:MAG: ROK family protein [Bacteroides sp.]|nr:ROK family protein [Ruminococcus flavefaciens]MCM1553966.1 ROK family protein [Bacteroides sp.]